MKHPKKENFDLSHKRLLTTDFGKLTPTFVQEVVPNQSINLRSAIGVKTPALLFPVMHETNIYTHYFFVPNRIVVDNVGGNFPTALAKWENVVSGYNSDGDPETNDVPLIVFDGGGTELDYWKNFISVGSLVDGFGLPPNLQNSVRDDQSTFPDKVELSAIPFLAYQLIYNEFYRDQDLQDDIFRNRHLQGHPNPGINGQFSFPRTGEVMSASLSNLMSIRYRNFEKDYFTSARPRAQRGAPVASIDLTVASLRMAERIQKYFEKINRTGSRYFEFLRGFFGTSPNDGWLNRPLYLGGFQQSMGIQTLLATNSPVAKNPDVNPQGNQSGHVISHGVGLLKFFAKEHGFVFGLTSIMPRTMYSQGIPRMFTRKSMYDFYNPEFQKIGEQEVLAREIMLSKNPNFRPNKTWGYQARYNDYKFRNNEICGEFRNSMQNWHLGRIFRNRPDDPSSMVPNLSSDFVSTRNASQDFQRIFAWQNSGEPGSAEWNNSIWLEIDNMCFSRAPMLFQPSPGLF